MRLVNAVVTTIIMMLFFIHMIWGGLELAGVISGGSKLFLILSCLLIAFIIIHMIISLKFTADTIKACRISKVSYFKENRIFWLRRISGVALMLFIIIHVLIFLGKNANGVYLLNVFNAAALISQLLMVVSLLVHLISNITPLRIAFGIVDKKDFKTDLILVFSILYQKL